MKAKTIFYLVSAVLVIAIIATAKEWTINPTPQVEEWVYNESQEGGGGKAGGDPVNDFVIAQLERNMEIQMYNEDMFAITQALHRIEQNDTLRNEALAALQNIADGRACNEAKKS